MAKTLKAALRPQINYEPQLGRGAVRRKDAVRVMVSRCKLFGESCGKVWGSNPQIA